MPIGQVLSKAGPAGDTAPQATAPAGMSPAPPATGMAAPAPSIAGAVRGIHRGGQAKFLEGGGSGLGQSFMN